MRTVSLCSTLDNTATLRSSITSPDHFIAPFAPLARVLPRVQGVVHSGSHGTNSMTLAAGLPAVVMPSIFDQVWHARRQEQLGTGIHAPKGRDLATAIARLVDDPSLAERSAAFAALLATEDGVRTSAQRIEDFLA